MSKTDLTRRISGQTWAIIVIALIIIAGIWYGLDRASKFSAQVGQLSEQLLALESRLSSTTTQIQEDVTKNYVALSQVLAQEQQSVGTIKEQLGAYKDQVGSLSGTLTTLQKLSKTDPELLQKYSKVFFLNEHYSPPRLSEIPNEYEYSEEKTLKIHAEVWPYMKRMIDDAKAAGVTIYVFSAYRSFNEQGALKGQYSVTYGAGTANTFSADQGYSEHQLGTTVDFITSGLSGQLEGFDGTKAYQWLQANAHRYGFTLSYPKNNKFYVYEPWHWRFVGVKLATYLYNEKQNFYDVDQRKIDEYLVSVFE